MEAFKEFCKNHKVLLIGLGIALIVVIIFAVIIYRMFFAYGNDKYGDRLDPIIGLEISDYTEKKLIEELTDLEKVTNVKMDIKGRLINIIFTVEKDLDKDTAKEYGERVLEYFSDEEKDAYDIQVFVVIKDEYKEEEEKVYPIIGYRKATLKEDDDKSRGITWGNN